MNKHTIDLYEEDGKLFYMKVDGEPALLDKGNYILLGNIKLAVYEKSKKSNSKSLKVHTTKDNTGQARKTQSKVS